MKARKHPQSPSTRSDLLKNSHLSPAVSKNRIASQRHSTKLKNTVAHKQLESQPCAPECRTMHSQESSNAAMRLRGVHQNTLKGWDIDIPLGQLVVVTGVSGTGKSSLVFDTLHAEGQRRYCETFSPYLRQFLERLERPKVDSIENIRPSIAIEQATSIKTSRSTVGTMTELCDYFKVWFCHNATLFDPVSGKPLRSESPATAWEKIQALAPKEPILITFAIHRPESMPWASIFETLQTQGFTRVLLDNIPTRLDSLSAEALPKKGHSLTIIQDEFLVEPDAKSRFLDSATEAFRFGQHQITLYTRSGKSLGSFSQTLRSPATGREFTASTPALFSFNSPVGACPECRGFGRVIGIDSERVIPDTSLTVLEGAIRPFQGAIFQESLQDLKKFAKKLHIRLDVPWSKMTEHERTLIWRGEPDYGKPGRTWPKAWYGIDGFFKWLDSKAYKMHVRVFLSKYRSYNTCANCNGARLQPDALNFKWSGHTLPALYEMPVRDLLAYFKTHSQVIGHIGADAARDAILNRLSYLDSVGLGYLTLNRPSRTLSGGETQRVNLTTCLGSALTDTLFVLDEPSVGMHASDLNRIVEILKNLVNAGNTVVVVEHDEAVMRAAHTLIELGPEGGIRGGELVHVGPMHTLVKNKKSLTGQYLSGKLTVEPPATRRAITKSTPQLKIRGLEHHNLSNFNVNIPLGCLVALAGVSGCGKSTLMRSGLYHGSGKFKDKESENPAKLKSWSSDIDFEEILWVDQTPLSKTPRSNPAVYTGAWDGIRKFFGASEESIAAGFGPEVFSFNSKTGQCPTCEGLGFEAVDMQFLSDLYLPCSSCEGQRFKPEVLAIRWNGYTIHDILELDAYAAIKVFAQEQKIISRLQLLIDVGLGYLKLGQPLNTLSGGESQRLKLVRELVHLKGSKPKLCLLDEPTTGLHRHDVKRLLAVLQKLVGAGHSVVLIEHHLDVLATADWLIELGPGAGADGGTIVAEGPPELIAKSKTATAGFLKETLSGKIKPQNISTKTPTAKRPPEALVLTGAREHNLKSIDVSIPLNSLSVVTGVSGSGKSSLAFDVIFAEGQRRFMESMSAYIRQFIEQLPRADFDRLSGIPPTVAIEQRSTRGGAKSTVASITEVLPFLRLLFAKTGIQYNPATGQAVTALEPTEVTKHALSAIEAYQPTAKKPLYVAAQKIRHRKGHYAPLAHWAREHGYTWIRVDGKLITLEDFKPLARHKEHTIEIVVDRFEAMDQKRIQKACAQALELGNGQACLLDAKGNLVQWLSTKRVDPTTGEAFPELDPKHFSWHSPQGWCESCLGTGLNSSDEIPQDAQQVCPSCNGDRLNVLSRNVFVTLKGGKKISLPELLKLNATEFLATIQKIQLAARERKIADEILPAIHERLGFLEHVGLDYLGLDRPSYTLSGGEGQRIRLAAALSSNLSGVLYVLDEPSIGLHARDNAKLIESLKALRDRSNTVVVVEHDEDTLRAADYVIDLGPGAGRLGGEILAQGPLKSFEKSQKSLTAKYLTDGITHPTRGNYRVKTNELITLEKPTLRNLKGDTLHIPKERLTVICGPSGAGKSTLIREVLAPAVADVLLEKKSKKTHFKSIQGLGDFKGVLEVDQSPIGLTSRSTPATYIGAFDLIRDLYASTPEANWRGLTRSAFSFNTKGGRCDSCQGSGTIKLEMNFLPRASIPCDACGGKRYGPMVEPVLWKGLSIGDCLERTFEEAVLIFDAQPKLRALCALMVETGLGYLTLGQPSPTLSGGEAQRLKLVCELSRGLTKPGGRDPRPQKHLYILEEPTLGLHAHDVVRLLGILHRLVDQGHTVVVIEHHLDVIADADYVVELGPTGGPEGGHILYQGNLQGLLKLKKSPTAPFLKHLLK